MGQQAAGMTAQSGLGAAGAQDSMQAPTRPLPPGMGGGMPGQGGGSLGGLAGLLGGLQGGSGQINPAVFSALQQLGGGGMGTRPLPPQTGFGAGMAAPHPGLPGAGMSMQAPPQGMPPQMAPPQGGMPGQPGSFGGMPSFLHASNLPSMTGPMVDVNALQASMPGRMAAMRSSIQQPGGLMDLMGGNVNGPNVTR